MENRFRFRCWSKKENEMFYNAQNCYDYMQGIYCDCFGDLLKDKRYVVMQCTGLKDKNGKLIYEGDIVHINKFNCEMFVVWNKEQALFELRDCWCKFEGANIRYGFDDREVIGNIYENKDLLEE